MIRTAWRATALVALALGVVMLSACGSAGSGGQSTSGPAAAVPNRGFEDASKDQSGSGGTLIIGMSASNIPIPNTPPDNGFEGRRWVGYQIYDGLMNWDLAQGETVPQPKPALAERYTVGEDKLTWTFNLRRGVKFHDGTDFNAEAVVFNLDRIMNRDFQWFDPDLFTPNVGQTQLIAGYRAVDPYTVEIKTKSPYSFFLYDAAYITFASPAQVRRLGNKEYIKQPVGTGPFRVDKYVDGEVMELVPNKDYWGQKPKIDRIILRPMPDPATRLAALQSGQVHWAEVPPPDSKKMLEATGFNISLKQYPHAIIFPLNVRDKPFDNPKVREALQYAIDREGVCTNLLGGLCVPASQLMYKGHPWYNEAQGDKYKYDPQKARQLLAEAGYPNGFRATIPYTTGGSGNMWPTMMEKLQQDLRQVGVELQIEPMEWNTLISTSRLGFADAGNRAKYQAMWSSPATNAPVALLTYASWRIPPMGCCNASTWTSADYDRLMNEAMAEFDQKKQDELLNRAMGLMASESPVLFFVHDLNFRAMSPKVRGFIQSQSWFADLSTVWVKP
jgi:peptide/nickel transport system substrate-binding protein